MVLCFYKSVGLPINSFPIVRGLKFKASLINANHILDNCKTEYINSKRINSNTNSKQVYVFVNKIAGDIPYEINMNIK